MAETVETLILDLLEWLGRRERTYSETMDAWRTSCPKLPIWEDANDRGLVAIEQVNGRAIVCVTLSGRALLKERRPPRGRASCQRYTCLISGLCSSGLRPFSQNLIRQGSNFIVTVPWPAPMYG